MQAGDYVTCQFGHLASLPCQLSKRPLASLQLGLFLGSDHLETGSAGPVWLEMFPNGQGHKPVRFQTADLTSWRLSLPGNEGIS